MSRLLPDVVKVTNGDEISSLTNGEGDHTTPEDSSEIKGRALSNCLLTDAPTDSLSEELYFDQGRPEFAQVREHCARAIFAYNNEYLEANKAKRADLWLECVG